MRAPRAARPPAQRPTLHRGSCEARSCGGSRRGGGDDLWLGAECRQVAPEGLRKPTRMPEDSWETGLPILRRGLASDTRCYLWDPGWNSDSTSD